MATAFRIHADDNVATLLDDAEAGEAIEVRGGDGVLPAAEPIALGHKVALQTIREDQVVVKFGVAIGTASRAIRAGEWVHLHNCRSDFDERSGGFDLATGAARDVRYD